jgi:hypothetical protein
MEGRDENVAMRALIAAVEADAAAIEFLGAKLDRVIELIGTKLDALRGRINHAREDE